MSPNLCQYIVGTHRREEELILPVSWWPTNDMFCSFCKKKKEKEKEKALILPINQQWNKMSLCWISQLLEALSDCWLYTTVGTQ